MAKKRERLLRRRRGVWVRVLTVIGIAAYLSGSVCYAQVDNQEQRTARHAVYGELGGAGIISSLNYEHLYSDQIVFRAGLFYFRVLSDNLVTVPLTASALVDLVPGLYAEFGAGVTYISLGEDAPEVAGTTLVGLRYYFVGGGLLKASLLPYTTYQDVTFHPGVAIGYSF